MSDAQELKKVCYSLEEACQILSIGRSTIYEEVKAGRLQASKVGRRKVFTREALERWAADLPKAGNYGESNRDS